MTHLVPGGGDSLSREVDVDGDGLTRMCRLVFASDVASVALARRSCREAVQAWGISDVIDQRAAELLVSELVTNAVQHTVADIEVQFSWDNAQLRVAVADDDPRAPAPRQAARTDVRGRGLAIVAAMSTQWGVEPRAPGKTVWFTMAKAPILTRLEVPSASEPTQAPPALSPSN